MQALEKAIFAGGCFWCIEAAFGEVPGIVSVVSGYTGGEKPFPTYSEVSSGKTGHVEAVEVTYDPSLISFGKLLDIFWSNVDPTDIGGQFADRGSQYATAIFYTTEEQQRIAQNSKNERANLYDKPIATKILKAIAFYPAEEYHQQYYKKHAARYNQYKLASGRAQYIHEMAKKTLSCPLPASNFMHEKSRLTPLEYKVTQEGATEQPFHNKYWDNHQEGIYVDIVSGEPLFSSTDKYDSGTGWPSFSRPIDETSLREVQDTSHGITRTEILSCKANSHLGHVFTDGPQPTGLRYCINSASLRFIPKEDLEKEGYGQYLGLFKK